jgi:hypothetical protein
MQASFEEQYDGDQFTANPLGTGGYFVMPPLSTSVYYVDEQITSDMASLYSGGGLSSRPVGRVMVGLPESQHVVAICHITFLHIQKLPFVLIVF